VPTLASIKGSAKWKVAKRWKTERFEALTAVATCEDRQVQARLYAFHDFVKMIGFQRVWDFEEKYADLLAVETAAA
jgi:hypothetical protein